MIQRGVRLTISTFLFAIRNVVKHMQNQSPISIAAQRAADHLRRHSDIFVQDGPHSMTIHQRAARQGEIERCADEISASRTNYEFEMALEKAHRLGAFPYDEDVSQVAFADVLYAH